MAATSAPTRGRPRAGWPRDPPISSVCSTCSLRLRQAGVTRLRWFFLCDARAGIRFRADGAPIEIQGAAWRDIDVALDLVRKADLSLMPVLFDFHLCRPQRVVNGVQTCGRSRLLSPRRSARAPAGQRRRAAAGATTATRRRSWRGTCSTSRSGPRLASGTWNPVSSVSKLGDARRSSTPPPRACTPRRGIRSTVGTASALTLDLVRGLGLDFYQPHWYDRFEARAPLARHTATLDCDAPIVLGEFPTCNSARTPGELLRHRRAERLRGRVLLVGAGRRRLHASRTGDRRRGGAQSLNRTLIDESRH